MALYKHIKELEVKIKHLKAEPVEHWFRKVAKNVKLHILERKLVSLRKEVKPNHHPKQHKFDPDVQ